MKKEHNHISNLNNTNKFNLNILVRYFKLLWLRIFCANNFKLSQTTKNGINF